MGDGDHHSGRYRQGGQHRNDYKLPGLGLAAFKGQEKRNDDFDNHQRAGKIVGSASQPKPKKQGCRNLQQENQERGNVRFFHFAASLFSL